MATAATAMATAIVRYVGPSLDGCTNMQRAASDNFNELIGNWVFAERMKYRIWPKMMALSPSNYKLPDQSYTDFYW